MRILNKLLMLITMVVTFGVTTSCGATDNSGDIIDQARPIDITIIEVVINENNYTIEFKCNSDANNLIVDWGDGTVDSEHSHAYTESTNYTITISGHVTSLSFSDENGLYASGNESINEVFFSSTITTLPKYSFNIRKLRAVTMPDSIKNIGEYAFNRSQFGIKFFVSHEQKPQGWSDTWSRARSFIDSVIWGYKIGISNNYAYVMGKYNGGNIARAHLYDSETTEITIPDAVTFKGAKYLIFATSIRDSKAVTIHLPKYLRLLGGFNSCASLKTIDYSKCLNLISMDSYAFDYCPSLEEIIIPKTIEFIPEDTSIPKLTNLSKITVEEDNPIYYSPTNSNVVMKGDKIIFGCKGSIIPENTKIIGENAFKESKLKSVVIPNNVEKIGISAFYYSLELDTVKFLDGNLQEIGIDAFKDTKIKNIKLPSSVKYIAYGAFARCDDLEKIDVTAFTSEDKIPKCDTSFSENDGAKKTFIYSKSFDNEEQFVQKGWPKSKSGKIEWVKES